jgi:hypothetical protein
MLNFDYGPWILPYNEFVIAFSLEQAMISFYNYDSPSLICVLCIDIPNCKLCTCIHEATEFYKKG